MHPLISDLNKPEILMGAYYPQNMNRYVELSSHELVNQYLNERIQRDQLSQPKN